MGEEKKDQGKEPTIEDLNNIIDVEEEDIDKTFLASFDGEDVKVPNDPLPGEEEKEEEDGTKAEEESSTKADDDPEKGAKPEDKAEERTPEEIEEAEWEGVSPALRKRFEGMQEKIDVANNTAKSAEGRSRQLQGKLDKQAPTARVPSPDQLRAAMKDATKMAELKAEWPGHGEALEEQMNAVGNLIDQQRTEFETAQSETEARADKKLLDINHKGWENIVKSTVFKTWVYEGGPSAEQRVAYERLVEEKKIQEADGFFQTLLEEFPVWAEDRGRLFGSSSVVDSIELLTMHKDAASVSQVSKDTEEQERIKEEARQKEAEKKKKRLVENAAPTDGSTGRAPSPNSPSSEEAFLGGFDKPTSY